MSLSCSSKISNISSEQSDDDGGYEKEMEESLEDAYDDEVGRNGFYGGFYRSSDSCESQDSIIDDRPAPVFVSYDCYPSSPLIDNHGG